MATSKVSVNGNTIIDISDTTAVAADVVNGKVFYNVMGVRTVGTNSGYLPLTGGVVSGDIELQSTGIDISAADNGVSESTWITTNRIKDENGIQMGTFESRLDSNGDISLIMAGRNIPEGGDGTNYYVNTITLKTTKTGVKTVVLSDPAAWRAALGLGTSAGAFPLTIAQGGTNAITAAAARANLEITPSNIGALATTGGNITGQIISNTSSSYWSGRTYATIRNVGTNNSNIYRPLISGQTNNGSWEIATYNDNLNFTYITDTVFNSGANTGYKAYIINSNGVFSGKASGIKTSNSDGYETDVYGNFQHSSSTSSNLWTIKNQAGTDKFTVNFENGNTSIKGTLGVTGATTISSSLTVTGALTSSSVQTSGGGVTVNNDSGYFAIKRSDIPYTSATTSFGRNLLTLVYTGTSDLTDDSKVRAYLSYRSYTDNGTHAIELGCRRVFNTTQLYGYLRVGINSDQSQYVAVSSAAAWRTALGLGTAATQASTAFAAASHTHNYAAASHTHAASQITAGTFGGSVTLAATDGLITNNAAGWKTDQYGNFIHKRANTSDSWNISDSSATPVSKFKVVYDTGDTTIAGVLNVTGGILSKNIQSAQLSGAATAGGDGGTKTFYWIGNSALFYCKRDSNYIIGLVDVWNNSYTTIASNGSNLPGISVSGSEKKIFFRNHLTGALVCTVISCAQS